MAQRPADRGVGRPTAAKCYRLLRAAWNTAVDDELNRRNPCGIKGAGSEPAAERPVATAEQLLALAAAMPARWSAFVLLGASTSLRWGELLALTRSDVDLDEGTVRMRRSASEVDGQVVVGRRRRRRASAPSPSWSRSSRRSGSTWRRMRGHSSMRAALFYLHSNRGASKAIAVGIDRHLSEAAQKQDVKPADDDGPSGT